MSSLNFDQKTTFENNKTSTKKCAIIGAGICGLVSTKWALEYNVTPVLFEENDSVGGIWQYKPNDIKSGSVIKSTILNTSKEINAFSDFPPDQRHSMFMHNCEYIEYLKEYIQHNKLEQYFRLKFLFCFYTKKKILFKQKLILYKSFGNMKRHKVVAVKRSTNYTKTGKWLVQYYNKGSENENEIIEEIFDAVLLCIGHTRKPNREGIHRPNIEKFKGRILHACEYKDTDEFLDQTSVIVGLGNSASDIAVELSRVSKKVYLSTRSGAWVFRRTIDSGRPLDMDRCTYFNKYVLSKLIPTFLMERMFRNYLYRLVDHEKCGLKPEHSVFAKLNVINDELVGRILCGTIKVKPDILEFLPNGVTWQDGSQTEGVENVIFATGYIFDTNLVEEGKLISVRNHRAELYKNIFSPALSDHNTLGVIGLQYTQGSAITPPELQARLFFAQFTQTIKLPSKAEMIKSCKAELKMGEKRFGNHTKRMMTIDIIKYMDDISSLIKCTPPSFIQTVFTDPQLAWALMFGPHVSYFYRLRGPHAWSGARDAILGVEYRTDYPLYEAGKSRGILTINKKKYKPKFLAVCALVGGVVLFAAVAVKLYKNNKFLN